MYDFDYHRPASIAEARSLLESIDNASILAGGMTLLPTMKMRLAQPSCLIDLCAISELRELCVDEGILEIGAMVCHADVAGSGHVSATIPALARLAGGIGDAQVRNRGTIGGSIANSDPSADYPAALLGLGAKIRTDRRDIAADDFFTGMFETRLEDNEIVQAVVFPIPARAAYVKFPNPASRYAVVGVFVAETTNGVRVAVTGAAACAFREHAMEAALERDFSVKAVQGISVDGAEFNEDLHASAEYRTHLVSVMAARAVAAAGG